MVVAHQRNSPPVRTGHAPVTGQSKLEKRGKATSPLTISTVPHRQGACPPGLLGECPEEGPPEGGLPTEVAGGRHKVAAEAEGVMVRINVQGIVKMVTNFMALLTAKFYGHHSPLARIAPNFCASCVSREWLVTFLFALLSSLCFVGMFMMVT